MKSCILCQSPESKTVFNENGTPILECKSCGHVYSSYEQEEHYEGYWDGAEQTYDLKWWDNAHRAVYSDFISTYLKSEKGNLLDVGCGLGFFVKAVLTKKTGWSAVGYEISKQAVKFANEQNGMKTVYAGLVQDSKLPKESFDIITLWDVIEHIPKPHSLLTYLHGLLKPGGILFLQTPNFPIQLAKANLKVKLKGMQEGVHYLEAKDHVNNYKMHTLAELGKQCGFINPKYKVLMPILSVSGSKSKLAVYFKLGYYYFTKLIFTLSFGTINWNNTLFLTLVKP
ncbi:class I SAM-dependent methyltransferase [Leptospira kanakyensis]|uniref:Methyltransferase domain-containing protein n=1 Tax=Leptospira kanakyensis TaxID=2484968 RepID=A0A6N4Q5Z1_9LEPT|nr:class I SAM-dependent methyltransferase [Leptospira kanakyensis]MCW7480712.1 class I SAM-dependent methyltransferase [Leptospira kanakyensis]TGK47481.1 methyltransferase domain-containing protein [Leptospira kanakyensis]TGK63516.1 methyltransferase domain-containing protein [Leptospira kanakyensis]TGK67120.1 methyltransferase domain-containing protein [Leptospira kanakyensis]